MLKLRTYDLVGFAVVTIRGCDKILFDYYSLNIFIEIVYYLPKCFQLLIFLTKNEFLK